MVPLYKALIRPIIEYANPVWNPYTRKYIDLIENVQHYFTKCIIGLRKFDYETRLKILKLPSLEFRRVRGDMIEVYKMCQGIYDPNTTKSLLTFSKTFTRHNTRSHNFKLEKANVNTKQFKYFFSNRVVNMWNNLPYEVVNAQSINQFKNLFDKLYSGRMYDTNFDLYY